MKTEKLSAVEKLGCVFFGIFSIWVFFFVIDWDVIFYEHEQPQETYQLFRYVNVDEIEALAQEVTTEQATEPVQIYDVPLSAELQQYIMEQSLDHNINPALVFAIIEIESNYDTTAAGDNGSSIGLMQISTYWHRERMDKLGVTDLSNPYQNVDVGIDILSELFAEYEDINFVLMSYNGGVSYAQNLVHNGIYSTEYTEYVTRRMQELDCDVARKGGFYEK